MKIRGGVAVAVSIAALAAPSFTYGAQPSSGVFKGRSAKVKDVTKTVELPTDLQRKARILMKSLNYETALPILERLKSHPGASVRLRAEVFIDLGISHINLGSSTDAKAAFLAAIDLDATVEPPSSSAPKVQKLFLAARNERFPPAPPPVPFADAPAEVALAPVARSADLVEVVEAPPEDRGGARLILPIALGGLAAGALGVGIFCGIQSSTTAATIRNSVHTRAEVDALQAKHSTMSTISIIGYVSAGIAVTGAATAFFLTRGSASGARVSVSVGSNGAMANTSVSF